MIVSYCRRQSAWIVFDAVSLSHYVCVLASARILRFRVARTHDNEKVRCRWLKTFRMCAHIARSLLLLLMLPPEIGNLYIFKFFPKLTEQKKHVGIGIHFIPNVPACYVAVIVFLSFLCINGGLFGLPCL